MDSYKAVFAVFVEARTDTQRVQWVTFPPALSSLGANQLMEYRAGWMQRTYLEKFTRSGTKRAGNWQFYNSENSIAETIERNLEQYKTAGWRILDPVVVKMDSDDYQRIWNPEGAGWAPSTPYKLLRAVDRVTKQRGYRLVGPPEPLA